MDLTFTQALAVLRARWQLVAAIFALVLGGALAAAALQKRAYTASASLVVDFKPDPVSAIAYGGMPPPAFVATQVEVLRSERVARRVLALLKPDTAAALRARWQDKTGGRVEQSAWLVEDLADDLVVQPAREGSVIAVRYTAPEPALAAELANAFVRAYIDTSLELRTDPARQSSGFFEERVRAARAALEQAQSKLSAFQAAKGIVAADERMDVENARLNELSSQLTSLQGVAAESSSRQVAAQGERGDRMQEVMANPLVAQLRAEVAKQQAQLQQLGTRLGDNHPQVLEARATLAELRARLDAETQRVTGSVGVAASIDRRREAELRGAVQSQRDRVLRMKSVRDEGLVLQRDVDGAQRAYDTMQQRLSQTSLESQSTLGQAHVLAQATPPLVPSSPRLLLNAALGVLLGGLLAVAAALLLELRDRRVRTDEELFAITGLPLLAVLPMLAHHEART